MAHIINLIVNKFIDKLKLGYDRKALEKLNLSASKLNY